MASSKLSDLSAASGVTSDDLVYLVNDPLGTPTSQKATGAQVKAFVGSGKRELWVPASAMFSRVTSGAAEGSGETTTNRNNRLTLDFDASTQEYAQAGVRMPKSWDEGTVTFRPVWSHPSTSTNFGVVWTLSGVAIGDGDALDAAQGTAQSSTDTGGTTDTLYIGPESSAITIGGSPAEGDYVTLEVSRLVSDGGDTMAVDARLHGIALIYTTNAATDD